MRTTTTSRVRAAVGMLASAALVAGCASTAKETDSSDSAQLGKDEIYVNGLVGNQSDEGEPKDGGTLTIAEYAEARSLDPTKTIPNGAVGGNAMAAVYDTLLRYDVESGTYEPHLAESFEAEDGTTWTLKLRDGVTFTDGTALDATAVVSSVGYYMSGGFNALALATNIKDMKPVDERTVVFTLNRPWHNFPSMLAGGAGMVMAPAAYDQPEEFEPIGAGPFAFESYKPGEELVLTANEEYWDGAPHLDALRFIWLGSDDTRLEALESGTADTAYLRSAKVVEQARQEGLDGAMTIVGLGNMLWMNNREGALSDVRVRQAINHAIDRQLYIDRVHAGAGLPTASIVPEQSTFYSEVELAEHDPEKAKELLEAAKADGFDGKITYLGQSDQQSKAAAVAFQGMLEAVGFDVEIESLRNVTDQVQRIYVDHTFDLATSSMSVADEEQYTRYFSNVGSQSPQNPSGYANPEMDELIGALQASSTPEKTTEILASINTLWQETQPGINLGAAAVFYPWNDDVHGVVPTSEQIILLDEAWKG